MATVASPHLETLKTSTESGRIDNLIVKVAELCNLNCRYCFIYNHEDKGYLHRPKFMEGAVFEQLLLRIKEYCERRAPHKMSLTMHGGEPTLIGPNRMARFAERARKVLGESFGGINLQTNGTLVTDEWIRVLAEHQIAVGVSLDGPASVHDANRVDHAGRGSHASALRGLKLLQKRGFHPGALCVIDPGVNGLEVYRYFRSLNLKSMDFLFPDVSWESKQRLYDKFGQTPVADYLIPIFDEWFTEDDPDVRIRLFWGLLSSMIGGNHFSDAFGNPLMSYLIIETDGSIQALDALRVCEDGITDSNLNIATHGFDDLHLGAPLVYRVIHEGFPLCAICNSCQEVHVCGGGYLPHRYSRARAFDNPSVWCVDILKLIAHIRFRVGIAPGMALESRPLPLEEREAAR